MTSPLSLTVMDFPLDPPFSSSTPSLTATAEPPSPTTAAPSSSMTRFASIDVSDIKDPSVGRFLRAPTPSETWASSVAMANRIHAGAISTDELRVLWKRISEKMSDKERSSIVERLKQIVDTFFLDFQPTGTAMDTLTADAIATLSSPASTLTDTSSSP